jgi:MoxR-like ATPase
LPIPRHRALRRGALIHAQPEENRQENRQAWQLKLEGIAREIDAAFAPEQLTEELATVRHEIVAALS